MDAAPLIGLSPLAAMAAALLAGLASSASPCAVAAVPLVVGYVGGYAVDDRRRAFLFSAAFVLGLSLAFTLLGAAVAYLGASFLPSGPMGRWIAGGLTVAVGIHLLFELPLPRFLSRACAPANVKLAGPLGAFAAGALSGVVFSPCATPILIAILALIGTRGDFGFGMWLMFLYSLGHGAVLLVAGSSIGLAGWLTRSAGAKRIGIWLRRGAGLLLAGFGAWLALVG